MLTYEPNKRFSIQECLKHAWFEKFNRKNEINNDTLKNYYTNIISFKVSN